jgi:preprotein translocase subunit SecF
MNIIGKKYIFLTISGILVLASLTAIVFLGWRPGADFTGGTLWQIQGAAKEDLAELMPEAVIIPQAGGGFLIRAKEISEPEHQILLQNLKSRFPDLIEERFESIGPTIGRELKNKAVTAFVLVLAAISIYIALAFRKVSRPVASWKYGLITVITLFHDAIIPAGLMAFLGYWRGAEIDTNFIVAILVVIGFSVHDTIVVFDRIRENLRLTKPGSFDFPALINRSVNETLARSINTSLTLVLVLAALYVFGSASLSYFSLVILTGTIVGTYSSICIASPLLALWQRKSGRLQ